MQYNVTYRQKDKGWQYIISYKDIQGAWKQKSKQGFEKKKDAQRAADERVEELKKEVDIARNLEPEYVGITFGEFAKQLIEHEKLHKTQNTISNAQVAVKKFDGIKDIPLTDLKHSDIQNCVDAMISEGCKLSTVKQYISKIKYILGQAVEPYKLISAHPVGSIKLPALQYEENNTENKALNDKQVAKLLEALKSDKTPIQYYYLCVFALETGLRAGEILGLTWDNVDFHRREIHVVRQWKYIAENQYGFGTLKKKNSKRIVPMAQSTIKILKKYKQASNIIDIDNRVFPIMTRTVQRFMFSLSKELGFRVSMHTLRHTYATKLIANGLDFKTTASILGHDVKMTMKVYSHVTDDMMENAAKKINSIF